jgi:hypothetical protein
MNILEQLQWIRSQKMILVTTLEELAVGDNFYFCDTKLIRLGTVIYIREHNKHAYGRAIIWKAPGYGEYHARRID